MRVLLDECVPRNLRRELPGHEVRTVVEMGWAGTRNGLLLRQAAVEFDAFLTVDQGIEFQQHLVGIDLAVIVMAAPSNKIEDLRLLMPRALAAISSTSAGEIVVVRASQGDGPDRLELHCSPRGLLRRRVIAHALAPWRVRWYRRPLRMEFEIVGPLRNPETIAAGPSVRDHARLRRLYGRGRWRKRKGIATVRLPDGVVCEAEVHWYEATGIGRICELEEEAWFDTGTPAGNWVDPVPPPL